MSAPEKKLLPSQRITSAAGLPMQSSTSKSAARTAASIVLTGGFWIVRMPISPCSA